jgi:hypothetical protein
MSDELTFLRWCYVNADRFDNGFRTYRHYLHEAYVAETGNKVPNDYEKGVKA